jgi:hypothetical protein
VMGALTPASAEDLPPLGELVVYDPFWRHPAWGLAREGVAHLRIWTTATGPPGYVAVVTEIDFEDSVTQSAGRIWAELARRYGPSVVLFEHHPGHELTEDLEALDLVRVVDGSLHWSRIWPTRRRIRVTPGSRSGWPTTGTRSSADQQVNSIRVKMKAANRRTVIMII